MHFFRVCELRARFKPGVSMRSTGAIHLQHTQCTCGYFSGTCKGGFFGLFYFLLI